MNKQIGLKDTADMKPSDSSQEKTSEAEEAKRAASWIKVDEDVF